MIIDILQPLGYKLLKAADGYEAIDIVNTTHEKIDLLLTDMVMPGMNGRELAEKLTARQSDMKVVFMSGYKDDTIVNQGSIIPGSQFISKPLVPSNLTNILRDVLEERK